MLCCRNKRRSLSPPPEKNNPIEADQFSDLLCAADLRLWVTFPFFTPSSTMERRGSSPSGGPPWELVLENNMNERQIIFFFSKQDQRNIYLSPLTTVHVLSEVGSRGVHRRGRGFTSLYPQLCSPARSMNQPHETHLVAHSHSVSLYVEARFLKNSQEVIFFFCFCRRHSLNSRGLHFV